MSWLEISQSDELALNDLQNEHLKLLKQQIEKDLQLELASHSPEDIVHGVLNFCQEKSTKNREELQTALYRVDVSDAILSKAFQEKSWPEENILCWCILRREYQKIRFRTSFK